MAKPRTVGLRSISKPLADWQDEVPPVQFPDDLEASEAELDDVVQRMDGGESLQTAKLKDAKVVAEKRIAELKPSQFAMFLAIVDAVDRSDQLCEMILRGGRDRRLLLVLSLPSDSWCECAKSATGAAFAYFSSVSDEQMPLVAKFYRAGNAFGRDKSAMFASATFSGAEIGHMAVLVSEEDVVPSIVTIAADATLEVEVNYRHLTAAIDRHHGDDVGLQEFPCDPALLEPTVFDFAVKRASGGVEALKLLYAMHHDAERERQADDAQKAKNEQALEGTSFASAKGKKSAKPNSSEHADGLLVLPKLGDEKRSSDTKQFLRLFEGIAGKPTPLIGPKEDVETVRRAMLDAWPHAREIVDLLLIGLSPHKPICIRPMLLVGAPGTGKTTILTELAAALSLPSIVYPCATVSDSSFGGTPAQWSSRRASTPLELIRQSQVANPLMVLDEIEKTGQGSHNGSLVHALLPMLERHTAKAYFETALDMSADLSGVNYLATANSLDIPAPLRDRFQIVRMPDPGPEHIGQLSRRIIRDIARDRGLDERFIEPLDQDEIDVIHHSWNGGSLRKLGRAVRATVDVRERLAVMQ